MATNSTIAAAGGAPEEKSVLSFPIPPSKFYELYTDENVQNGVAPQPPGPVKGKYEMFGDPFDTEEAMIRPLNEQNIDQLYPQNYDRKAELKKLNRSVLVCFLELLDILIHDPASSARHQKITDLTILFINMNHLINEYRPHQARETLRVIMERQRKQREEVITQVQKATDKAKSILKECHSILAQAIESGGGGGGGGVREKEEAMDTTTSSGAAVPRMAEGEVSHSPAHSLIDPRDAELCNIIDAIIS